MLRHRITTFSAVSMLTFLLPHTIMAATIDCSLSGYTFMGGVNTYVSTAAFHAKTYFLAQPLNSDYSGANYWGYGWMKFDNIGNETVQSARLYFNLLGVGSMSVTAATPANPAMLDLYEAGSIDVADLVAGDDEGEAEEARVLRETLRDNLDAESPLSLTMTANGLHSIDITDIYNSWATGIRENHGLVFSAPDNNSGAKYAGFGSTAGAPYIVTTVVPEPGAFAMLAAFLIAIGFVRLWKRHHISNPTMAG